MNAPEFKPDAPVRVPGLAALVVIARFHAIPADSAQWRHASGLGNRLSDADSLVLCARSIGLKAR
jgi:ATP-binding cassette, subfamily B, bacterial HlyB/CyaB